MEYRVGGACGTQKKGEEKCIQRRDYMEYLGSYGVILNESSGWVERECFGFFFLPR
jgi:hypothetical protein